VKTSFQSSRELARRRLRVGLCILLVGAVSLELLVGPVPITIGQALTITLDQLGLPSPAIAYGPAQRVVLLSLRAPRVLAAGLVGAGLGSSGAALQGLFRNPLADPQLIGVSSGAMVGASAVIVLGVPTLLAGLEAGVGAAPVAMAAFAGALLVSMLVHRLATVNGRPSMTHMLLAGIAFNAAAGAMVGVLAFVADDVQLRDLSHWMLGEVGRASWPELPWLVLGVVPAIFALRSHAAALDVSLLGDAAARDLGVDVDRLRRHIVIWVALAVGVSVACTGPIGFVGLAVPHLLRLIVGSSHRSLFVDAALGGACLLLVADAFARVVVAPAELPVGILTALLGAPLFLGLLLRDLRRRG
jgi:iron complex transport system permease protein